MNPNRASHSRITFGDASHLVLGGTYIAYRAAGSGPLTVLVPALQENSLVFAFQLRNSEKLGRVVAFDHVGSGESDRPSIQYRPVDYVRYGVRFLDKLVQEPARICAHRDASGLAVALALLRPEKVTTLVLVNPELLGRSPAGGIASSFRTIEQARLASNNTRIGQYLSGLRISLDARLRFWRIARAARGRNEALRYSSLRNYLALPGTKTIGIRMRTHVANWSEWTSRLSDVSVPVRVVVGQRVRSKCAFSLRIIKNEVHRSEIVEIEGTGWYPMIEAPERFEASVWGTIPNEGSFRPGAKG
ncbi:MAG: hypothetical protein C4317_07175 [Acidimicrobiia bacterium]